MKKIQIKYEPRDPSGKDPLNLLDRLIVTAEIGGERYYQMAELRKPIEELPVETVVKAIADLLEMMNEEQENFKKI